MTLLVLAQASPENASLIAEALTLMVVGMGVVFVSLAILMGVISYINRLGQAETPAQPETLPRAVGGSMGELDPQLVAVLAAAATVALNRPVQVTGVRRTDASN